MSADPLAFFAGESSESDSGDEDDDVAQGRVNQSPPRAPGSSTEESVDKLPSPNTLFATVGRPAFLDNPLDRHINWDRFVKVPDLPPEPNIHSSGHYVAIPPPKEDDLGGSAVTSTSVSTSTSSSAISAPPVRYSAPSELDPKQLTVSNKLPCEGGASVKRPHKSDSGEEVSNKKLKSDTFRHKEKRKRDLGQSSRGKSYVEEEKRILRQQYNVDEVHS